MEYEIRKEVTTNINIRYWWEKGEESKLVVDPIITYHPHIAIDIVLARNSEGDIIRGIFGDYVGLKTASSPEEAEKELETAEEVIKKAFESIVKLEEEANKRGWKININLEARPEETEDC